MKTCTSAFNTEKVKTGNDPRTLLVFHFPAPTGDVYVSDGPWVVGATTYRALVLGWTPIYKRVNPDPRTFDTSDWRIDLANDEGTPFSDYFNSHDPLEVTVDVYHWFDGLADSDKLLIDTFVITDTPEVLREKISLELASLMELYDRPVGTVISKANWPYADPGAVGKIEPIVFGSTKAVPCPCVRDGGYSTLVSDITAAATSLEISGLDKEAAFPAAAPFTVICGTEEIRVTSLGSSPYKVWTVTRGYNSTTAAAHKAGTILIEKRALTYLAAGHVVKTLNDVYVKLQDSLVRVASGVTKNVNDSGKATLVFADKFTLEKAVDLDLTDPDHDHGLGYNTSTVYATSYGEYKSSSFWAYSGNSSCVWDEDEDGCLHRLSTNGAYGGQGYFHVGFPAWNGPTPTSVKLFAKYLYYTAGAITVGNYCKLGLSAYGGDNLSVNSPSYSTAFYDCGTTVPSDGYISLKGDGSSGWMDVIEMWLVVTTDATASASTGITLSGDSASDVLVGGEVFCDVDGYADDGSGTYTGTPNLLIENPAHRIRHAAVVVGGCPAAYAPSANFSAAASSLATAGYKFGGCILEQISLKELLAKLAYYCRCLVFEDSGTLRIKYRPSSGSAPASQKSITKSMILFGSIEPEKTKKNEIINDFIIHYDMDWSKGGVSAGNCLAVCDASTAYPSGGDTTSIGKVRLKRKEHVFEFVTLEAMAKDLRDFYIGKYKNRVARIPWTGFSDQVDVERADTLDITHDAGVWGYSSKKIEVENTKYYPGSAKAGRGHHIEITAVETS